MNAHINAKPFERRGVTPLQCHVFILLNELNDLFTLCVGSQQVYNNMVSITIRFRIESRNVVSSTITLENPYCLQFLFFSPYP